MNLCRNLGDGVEVGGEEMFDPSVNKWLIFTVQKKYVIIEEKKKVWRGGNAQGWWVAGVYWV
jgi:hypothetical protein